MTDLAVRTIDTLAAKLPGRVSMQGDDRYNVATAIWAKPVDGLPRAVVHCRSPADVQSAIQAARDGDVPLSVLGGGHDWAGRALCDGLVIDMSGMNGVALEPGDRVARMEGGARAADVAAVTDPLGLAVVTGSSGVVGMAGLTLGGGYGPLIGRFGLALDNLVSAEVVLADGRIVNATHDNEEELFWALRGGGGNFGVVTEMRHGVHELPSIRAGMLLFPFAEATSVLQGCVEIMGAAPDALTVQLGLVVGPDGNPAVMLAPTWCGLPHEGEARLAPFFKLGTVLVSAIDAMPYGKGLAIFDPHIVNGQRVLMESAWLPALDGVGIDAIINAMANVASPGCAFVTHEFKGAASRVPEAATAFGLRRDHFLVEMIASFPDQANSLDEQRHRQWIEDARRSFDAVALPGGYPNFLPRGDVTRAKKSYGANAARLTNAKRRYDPDNVFRSAIPLPASEQKLAAE